MLRGALHGLVRENCVQLAHDGDSDLGRTRAASAGAKEESTAYRSPSSGVSAPAEVKRPGLDWATLHARTWGIDVWKCRCGGKRKVLAVVTSRRTAEEMLRNLALLQPRPPLPAAQSPPQIELAV